MMQNTLLLFVASSMMASIGCGAGIRPAVSGSVTYKGEPVPHQTLTLHWAGEDAEKVFMRRVFLDAEGKFAGDAPETGLYKVAIELPMSAQEGKTDAPGGKLKIPAKYRDRKTTDLTWTITSGSNHKDFVLVD